MHPNTKITTYEHRPPQGHPPTNKQPVIDDSKVSPNTPPWTSAAVTHKTTEDKDNRGLSNCTQNTACSGGTYGSYPIEKQLERAMQTALTAMMPKHQIVATQQVQLCCPFAAAAVAAAASPP
jgi:hypothetical protein